MRVLSLSSILAVALGVSSIAATGGQELTIVCAGDVLLGGSMLPVIEERGVQFPFEGTAELLRAADIAICNLEAPFGRGGEPFDKEFTFRVPPRCVEGLTYAGFDLVSLANNHIMDYGVGPLKETLSLLDDQGIGHSGAGLNIEEARRPAIIERDGFRVALLSYSNTLPRDFYAGEEKPGTAPGYERYLRRDIPDVKQKVDFLIVSFHWGGELRDHPLSYQRRLGRLAVNLGADLVIGHHPHIFQGIEVHKLGIIAYSLGNFAFGSSSSMASGVLLRLRLSREGTRSADVIPLCVRNDLARYQPKVLRGAEAELELNKVRDLSLALGTELPLRGGVGVIELP